MAQPAGQSLSSRATLFRFVLNGLAAAAIHFSVLFLLLKVVGWHSAGLANFVAACFGLSVSFLGNRNFVFRAAARPILGQASRFLVLYGLTAVMHGAALYGWTDYAGLDYRLGFLIAAGLQMILNYVGNRYLVFAT